MQASHEGVGMRKIRPIGYYREERFAGMESDTYDGVTEDAAAGVLVIGGNVQFVGDACHITEYSAGIPRLDEAFFAKHNAMRATLVKATSHASTSRA